MWETNLNVVIVTLLLGFVAGWRWGRKKEGDE